MCDREIAATREAVVNATNTHTKHGTTTIYPTISAYNNDINVEYTIANGNTVYDSTMD